MLSVSTMLLVVIMVAFLIYFYHNFIIDDFDQTIFDARLTILREYLNNSRDGTPYPTELGYVSDVNEHQFVVTYFSTANLTELRRSTHDDREETFSFIDQAFSTITASPSNIVPLLLDTSTQSNTLASSISHHPTDNTKYVAHLDDGDAEISCRTGFFDGYQCVAFPVCSQPDTTLPMTESRLNRLVYNNSTSKAYSTIDDDQGPAHSSLYVRCDEHMEAHVEQCENGEIFDGTKCVFDPTIETDHGLVTTVKRGVFGIHNLPHSEQKEVKISSYGDHLPVIDENEQPTMSQTGAETIVTTDLAQNYVRHYGNFGNFTTKNEVFDLNPINNEVNTPVPTAFDGPIVTFKGIRKAINFNVDPKELDLKTLGDGIDIKENAINFRSNRVTVHAKTKRDTHYNTANIEALKQQLEINDSRNYKLQQAKLTIKNLDYTSGSVVDIIDVNNDNKISLQPHLVTPVNDNSTHSCQPCNIHGAGHTFIDDTLSENQYLECLDDTNLFLHTCDKRLQKGGRYYCEREDVCAVFEKGNGEIVHGERNDNVSFDTGRTVCRDYNVFEVVECDTGNFVPNLRFNHPLAVQLHVNLPNEVYSNDHDECVPFDTKLVDINRDTFRITLRNPYDINFSSMAVGRVSKMDGLVTGGDSNDLHTILTYARDLDELAINPINGVSVECTDAAITVDLFSGSLYTLCDNNLVVEAGEMAMDQYYDVEEKVLAKSAKYNGQCRLADNVPYVNLVYRTIDNIDCFYSSPINI
ncbi:P91 [Pseudalatia unipuncta granulovirus]|uniref:P91 n=1 Tax=Pseudalatia unipuncta granulosis virus TaxID=36355 RepID=B6S6Z1_GVPU|nr:P91 [Pseudalatia unipuncta granulovirus]ACH69472.1 P91 [Pseudalatia unipuncta granulovirus]